MKAHILTPWIEHDNIREPLLSSFLANSEYVHRNGHPWSMSDVTMQPVENLAPDPNLLTVELTADPATIAAIEADPRFFVLWKD